MNYNVNIPQAPDLIQAMVDNQNTIQKQQAAQQMMMGGNGWGGGLEMLGAALGGFLNRKYGEQANQQGGDIQRQIQQFQAQKQQEMAMAEQAKKDQEARQKLNALIPTYGEEKARAIVFGGVKPDQFKGPDPTSQMQNIMSMGLQPGTDEWNKAMSGILNKSNAPVTNVNMPGAPEFGKIDAGHMMIKDENGGYRSIPVPGSQAARELEDKQNKSEASGKSDIRKLDNIQQLGSKVLKQIDGFTAGLGGSILKNIPGSSAADLEANLETLQADSAFSTLMEMKKNSPTGGALGAISERELGMLGSAQASLRQAQSPDQLRENVKNYLDIRGAILGKIDGDIGFNAPQQKKKGGREMVDANGNRAIVYPDGSFEEL